MWATHGGGHHGREHEGQARSCIVPFPDQSEYLSSLLDDPRIHDIAASSFGRRFQLHQRRRQFLRRRYALAFGRVQRRAHSQHQDRFLPRSADPGHGRSARHSGQSSLRRCLCRRPARGPARQRSSLGDSAQPSAVPSGGDPAGATLWYFGTIPSTPLSAARSGGACTP